MPEVFPAEEVSLAEAGPLLQEASPLEKEIRRRIAAAGPMPIDQYMELCLGHPDHGYYMTRDPFGARGDFITAPEISQMFGELIGLWMTAVWKQMGAPARVHVIELGPGRGTLMKDAIRASQVVPAFREAAVLHLVEISPALKRQQEQALERLSLPVSWHRALNEVPEGPAIVIANEFFDALPIKQAIRTDDQWRERRVGIDDKGNLGFTVAAEPLPGFAALLPPAVRAAPDGSIFEWRDDRTAIDLGRRLAKEASAALVIDYGHVASAVGDTFQAVGKHEYADALSAAGTIDLTAHVDFQALIRAVEAAGAKAFGPIEQGEFLRRLGIETRAATLKAKATRAAAADIDAALVRLTGGDSSEHRPADNSHVGESPDGKSPDGKRPAGMGTLFKVAAFTHKSMSAPPAFDR